MTYYDLMGRPYPEKKRSEEEPLPLGRVCPNCDNNEEVYKQGEGQWWCPVCDKYFNEGEDGNLTEEI